MHKIVLAAAVVSGSLIAASAHAAPNLWPALARADLDAVHQAIADNHPGVIDRENPAFKAWMDKGYAEAQARAARAASLGEVQQLLARYIAGFADGHMAISFNHQNARFTWPGIMVTRQGPRYVVSYAAKEWPVALPAVGAQLLSCDGRAADTIANEDLAPALFNLTTSDSVKGRLARFLFTNDELAPHSEYARCVFDGPGTGGKQEIALKWTSIWRDDFAARWDSANPQVKKNTTITEVAPGKWWVHLPQFQPNPEQEAEIKAVIARMPSLRSAGVIVFDIRGNGGGNSQWGKDVLEALYGKAYLDDLETKAADHGYAEWRVSRDNLAAVDNVLPRLKQQFAADAPIVTEFAGVSTRMKVALASGQSFVRQSEPAPARALTGAEPLTKARVALVTDANCASSCLNFADDALLLPGIRHFGYTTGADTVYMDVRPVVLPSGLARMVVAQKVNRGYKRGNNQPYVPHVQYDGHIGDTARVQEWVLKQMGP